jgi:hypothetical protein
MADLVHLTTVGSRGEADIICSMLRTTGIVCVDRDANLNPIGEGGLVRWREILVDERELDRARELLDSDPSPEA